MAMAVRPVFCELSSTKPVVPVQVQRVRGSELSPTTTDNVKIVLQPRLCTLRSYGSDRPGVMRTRKDGRDEVSAFFATLSDYIESSKKSQDIETISGRLAMAIQHAHSFSVKSFETREELSELKKEFAALQKTQKRDQLKMKQLEEQAEAATKAQSIALQKAEAALNVKKVAEVEKKEAEAKKAEAEKELRDALATKKAEIDAAYNQGMEDVAEDYKLQVKQACNKGFVLGWNAMAKQLDLPADSPWRKTKAMRLPCPLPQSQDESESEADVEDEDDTLVRKTKSSSKIDLTGDEEVEAAPKKADFGTLSSDLLLVGRSVEETLAEIDAEVAADKVAEVAADRGTEVAAEKEIEVLAVNDAKVVEQRGAEESLPESSEVPIQPSAQVEQA